MTHKEFVALAKRIAIEAHAKQMDKAGAPYWHHPAFVADHVETSEEKAVAWLHDVVEDTDWTFEALSQEGIPCDVIDGVKAITKREGETYETYLDRVKANPLAKAVKLADLMHNMDLTRIAHPTEKDFARIEKYHCAVDYLTKE